MTKTNSSRLRRKLKEQIRTNRTAADDILSAAGGRPLSVPDEVKLEEHMTRLEALERRKKLVRVDKIREPDIYERSGPHSFVRDLVAAQAAGAVGGVSTADALDRLVRHQQYTDTLRAVESRVARNTTLPRHGIVANASERALSMTAGAGGEFTPPAWLLQEFAGVARGVAPLRQLVRRLPLPDGCGSLSIPRFDTTAGVLSMPAQNANPSDAVDVPTDSLTALVETIAGEVLISQAMFDRGPGIDAILASDMGESYAAVIEEQLVNGTGTGGQHLGLLNVPSISTVTYTSASPTVTGVVKVIAETAATVANARKRPPTVAVMRPERYFWIAGETDGSTNEPAMRPGTGAFPSDADAGPFGPIGGLPVIVDDAIPKTLGGTQDVVLLVRTPDVILLEDDVKVSALITGGAQLTAAVVWHRYSALFAGRYSSGIGVATGTGFANPIAW
ncbi:MAG: phage major capsid protein [Acidimicrobiales bacterium]